MCIYLLHYIYIYIYARSATSEHDTPDSLVRIPHNQESWVDGFRDFPSSGGKPPLKNKIRLRSNPLDLCYRFLLCALSATFQHTLLMPDSALKRLGTLQPPATPHSVRDWSEVTRDAFGAEWKCL